MGGGSPFLLSPSTWGRRVVKALCPPKLALSCLQSTGNPRTPGELSVGRKGWVVETGRTVAWPRHFRKGKKRRQGCGCIFAKGPPRVAIKLSREGKEERLRRYFYFFYFFFYGIYVYITILLWVGRVSTCESGDNSKLNTWWLVALGCRRDQRRDVANF